MNNTPNRVTCPRTVAELMTAYQVVHGVNDEQLAAALGFAKGNVVTLIKRGVMALPLNKLKELAELTETDLERLVEMALEDRDPHLLELFREIARKHNITPSEMRMVEHCRQLAGGKATTSLVIDGRSVVALVVT